MTSNVNSRWVTRSKRSKMSCDCWRHYSRVRNSNALGTSCQHTWWRRLVGGCGEIALVLDPAQPEDWVLLLLPLIKAEREIGFLVKRDDKILVHLIFIKCSVGKKIIQPFITVCRLPFCRLWSFLHSIHSFIHCIHSFSELWRDRGSFRSETQKGPEEKTFKGREKTWRFLTREHGGLRVGSLIVFKYVKGI